MTESSDLVLTIHKLNRAIVEIGGGVGIQMPRGALDEEEGVEDEVTLKTLAPAVILGGLVAPEMKVKEQVQIGETRQIGRLSDTGCKLFLVSMFR